MISLLAILYLVCCIVAAKPLLCLLTGRNTAVESDLLLPWIAGWILCFFVIFFGGFFVTGLLNITLGWHWVDLPHVLPAVTIVALMLFWGSRQTLLPSRTFTVPNLGLIGWITIAAYSLLSLLATQQFPRGFEVAAYHLPSAVNILQTASIQPWDNHYPHTFPLNASLYYAFWLGFLPEKIVSASNFIFAALSGWVVYALTRQIGADSKAAIIAACGLMSVPMLMFGAEELGADLGGIFFLGLALIFGLSVSLPRRWLLAGLSMGLAFGFKSLHLLPIAFLGGWILFVDRRTTHDSERHYYRLQNITLFSLGIVATAGIWMLRNWLDFDNPFYPVNLPLIGKLAGWAIDPEVDFSARHLTQFEWVTDPAQWLLYPWIEMQQFGQHFKHSAGLGAFFATALPVSLLAACTAVLHHGFYRCQHLLLLVGGALFIITVWWLLDDRQPRYMLGAVLLLAPLSGWLLNAQPLPYRCWLKLLFSLCIIIMLGIISSWETIKYGDRILYSRQVTRAAFYEYPPLVDELPTGSTILNLGSRTWHYPLFGKTLQNRVISTPKARHIFNLPPNLGSIHEEITLDTALLQREKVDYVFSDGADIRADDCIQLHEIHRQTFNPLNHVPLDKPRTLYQVHYCTKPLLK